MLESTSRVDPGSTSAPKRTLDAVAVSLWLLAGGLIAVAVILSPARVAPYLPPQAERLSAQLATGIQLARLLFVGGALLAVVTDVIRRLWPVRNDSPAGASVRTRDLVVAGLLVGVALCLRLPNVTDSLWFDELGSETRIVQRGLPVILAFSADGNNHVGNSIFMWVASRFGSQEWVLRFPSLLIGTLLPASIFFLLQRVTSRSVALIVAGFIAIQFRMVDFSAEARGYIGHMAFGALASIAFAALMQAWSRRWAILYLVTASLSIWFVITGAYLVFTHVLIASGLLVHQWLGARKGDLPAKTGMSKRFLWCAVASSWALFCGLLVHVLALPQVMDYSRNFAPLYHRRLDLVFWVNALPFLVGVDHHVISLLLLLAAIAGYWMSRRDWRIWAPFVAGPLFLVLSFQIARNVASPRLFVAVIFPLLVGLSYFVDAQWRRGGMLSRSIAVAVVALLVVDSGPVFARYYFVGNPKLRELAVRIPANDTFLANMQANMNVYYFPKSEWEVDEDRVVPRLESLVIKPRFVLWGYDCRRGITPALETLGYAPKETLTDWTYAEHAPNQRRPCFALYERH